MHGEAHEPDDAALARRIASAPAGGAGAEEAALVARYARRVEHFGRRHLRDPSLAADLAQEVLEVVIRKLRAGEIRDPERLGSFVLGTARHLASELSRRAIRRNEAEAGLHPESEAAALPPAREDLGRLERCLGELAERERSVVLLTFAGGEDAAGIGRELGISPGNVRVIRHRAVAKLQACVGAGEAP